MQTEIWRDIPDYKGLYQVSNLGNVKSIRKNRLMKFVVNKGGYKYLCLYKNNHRKGFEIHQLVAMAFLGHVRSGYNVVCDHINNVKTDNRVENLQLISNRENSSKDRKGFSKYTGVHWCKSNKNWRASIKFKNKTINLGSFYIEEEASIFYQNALKSIKNKEEIKVKKPNWTSKYKGVYWHKRDEKWQSSITINGKQKHLGSFKTEYEAHLSYQEALNNLLPLNHVYNCCYPFYK